MDETIRMWDDYAATWAAKSDEMWTSGSRKTILPFLRRFITQGRLLDLGCGDGAACRLLSDFKVTGLDVSHEMLKIARARTPHATFVEGSLDALPFSDGAFDVILAVNSLEWTDRPLRALHEMTRVAPLAIISLLGPTAAPRANSFDRLLGSDAPMGNTMMPWELEQLAKQLGWTLLDSENVMKEGAVLTGDRLLDQAQAFSTVFAFKTR